MSDNTNAHSIDSFGPFKDIVKNLRDEYEKDKAYIESLQKELVHNMYSNESKIKAEKYRAEYDDSHQYKNDVFITPNRH